MRSRSVFVIFSLLISIGACSSPSPQFIGSNAISHTENGIRFDIYREGNNVQVIRLSGGVASGHPFIRLSAIKAIEKTIGCTVIADSVEGDKEVINAEIRCKS